MKVWSRIAGTFRSLLRRHEAERQLDDEVQSYVEMLADERIAAGMSAAEARRSVGAETGGIEQIKQAVRDRRASVGLEILWGDVNFGARQL